MNKYKFEKQQTQEKSQKHRINKMNREYLKSLQERAQRLLELSSDEEQSDQENFMVTKAKSRRVDLNEVLCNADINQLNTQFHDYRNTDVELLKRCIGLTNENTELKRQIKSFETEKAQLKAQNTYLQKELENYKSQLARIKQRQSKKNNGSQSPFYKLQEIDHFSFIQRNPAQSLKQKSQSFHRFRSTSRFTNNQEETVTLKQVQKLQQIYKKQIAELEQRLKAANQKRQVIETILQKEKEKTYKLWKFINQQIPQLKDIVTNLTNKVDVQVESILLKDINELEMKQKKRNHRNSTKNIY